MARCSGNKVVGIVPVNVISASFIVNNYTVNAVTAAFLLFKINSVVINSDTIKITLPATLNAASTLTQLTITNGNFTNYSPTVAYSSASQTTTITALGASANPGSSI